MVQCPRWCDLDLALLLPPWMDECSFFTNSLLPVEPMDVRARELCSCSCCQNPACLLWSSSPLESSECAACDASREWASGVPLSGARSNAWDKLLWPLEIDGGGRCRWLRLPGECSCPCV